MQVMKRASSQAVEIPPMKKQCARTTYDNQVEEHWPRQQNEAILMRKSRMGSGNLRKIPDIVLVNEVCCWLSNEDLVNLARCDWTISETIVPALIPRQCWVYSNIIHWVNTSWWNLILDLQFDVHELPVGLQLPNHLHRLKYGGKFNVKMPVGFVPESVKVLEFGDAFNQALTMQDFPKDVRRIEFGDKFNQPISALPPKLEYLKLGRDFNLQLRKDVLPTSLYVLEFGAYYDQPMYSLYPILPPSLNCIIFSVYRYRRSPRHIRDAIVLKLHSKFVHIAYLQSVTNVIFTHSAMDTGMALLLGYFDER